MAQESSVFAGAIAEAIGKGVKAYHQLDALLDLLVAKGVVTAQEARLVAARTQEAAEHAADELEEKLPEDPLAPRTP